MTEAIHRTQALAAVTSTPRFRLHWTGPGSPMDERPNSWLKDRARARRRREVQVGM